MKKEFVSVKITRQDAQLLIEPMKNELIELEVRREEINTFLQQFDEDAAPIGETHSRRKKSHPKRKGMTDKIKLVLEQTQKPLNAGEINWKVMNGDGTNKPVTGKLLTKSVASVSSLLKQMYDRGEVERTEDFGKFVYLLKPTDG